MKCKKDENKMKVGCTNTYLRRQKSLLKLTDPYKKKIPCSIVQIGMDRYREKKGKRRREIEK